jgi:hypothetical protein
VEKFGRGRGERGGADDGCPRKQGWRRPWHAVVQFEEAEEGRKEEEDESKRERECAGLNRRRRRAGARHSRRQAVAGAA